MVKIIMEMQITIKIVISEIIYKINKNLTKTTNKNNLTFKIMVIQIKEF